MEETRPSTTDFIFQIIRITAPNVGKERLQRDVCGVHLDLQLEKSPPQAGGHEGVGALRTHTYRQEHPTLVPRKIRACGLDVKLSKNQGPEYRPQISSNNRAILINTPKRNNQDPIFKETVM